MPVASSLNELKDALKTRETNITKALDELFGDPDTLQQFLTQEDWDHFKDYQNNPNIFGTQKGDSIGLAEVVLRGEYPGAPTLQHKLADEEIEHLENWPCDQKEAVRIYLAGRQPPAWGTTGGMGTKFHWELHSNNAEESDTASVADTVIFRSPQQNVGFSGAFAGVKKVLGVSMAEVEVEVDP